MVRDCPDKPAMVCNNCGLEGKPPFATQRTGSYANRIQDTRETTARMHAR